MSATGQIKLRAMTYPFLGLIFKKHTNVAEQNICAIGSVIIVDFNFMFHDQSTFKTDFER